MASTQSLTLSILAIFFHVFHMINAIDQNPSSDFTAPPNVDGHYFTFNGLRQGFGTEIPQQFSAIKATIKEFPALEGHSISMAMFRFPPAAVNPPHYHPRSAELMVVIAGKLEVGFVDTNSKVFTQQMDVGDIFLFPQAMIHYMVNLDHKLPATVLVAFNSANAGSVIVGNAIFGSALNPDAVAKAFKSDPEVIKQIKAGLAPKR